MIKDLLINSNGIYININLRIVKEVNEILEVDANEKSLIICE